LFFSKRLAELARDPVALFTEAVRIAETRAEPANKQFFGGLISGSDERDPCQARECTRVALRSPKLKDDAIVMIGSGKLQPEDLQLIVSLLQSGDVEPWQCATLSYGRGLDHLSPELIMPLLDELGEHGARGHWVVLDIISMYLLGGNQLVKLIADKLKSTRLARDLLDVSRQIINGHHLERMIKLLLQHGDLDRKFVAALMEQLLSICRSQKSGAFYAFAGPVTAVIASLLSSYPNDVWHEVSKVITSADSLVRFYAERLFDLPHEHHLAPGLLHGLPREVNLDRVRKAPGARAAMEQSRGVPTRKPTSASLGVSRVCGWACKAAASPVVVGLRCPAS